MISFKRKSRELPELPVPLNPALEAARAQIEQVVKQATEKVDATIARLRSHLEERDRKDQTT
jgi:hypothetical protein